MKIYLKRAFAFVGPQAVALMIFGIVASLVFSVIELMVSVFIQAFLVCLGFINQDIILFGHVLPRFSLVQTVYFLLIIGFLRFCVQILTTQSAFFLNETLSARLRCLCLHELFSKSLTTCRNVSEINFRLTEIFPKSCLFICNFSQFCTSFFQGVSLLLILFFTLWKEACLSVFGILCIGVCILYINKCIRVIAVLVPQEYEKLASGIERVFKNIVFLNVMKIKDKEYTSLISNVINYGLKAIRIYFLNSFATTLAPLLGIVLLVVVILVSHSAWHSQPTLLLAFMYLLLRFIQNLSALVSNYGVLGIYYPQFKASLSYADGFVLGNRLQAVAPTKHLRFWGSTVSYQANSEEASLPDSITLLNAATRENVQAIDHRQPEIRFHEVSYRYPGAAADVLTQMNLCVPAGSQLGIVGPSGAGKSTLLMLILGILKPTEGSITIAGQTPQSYFEQPHARVGYVGVDPFLIRGSLRDNVLYGIKHPVSGEELWESLRRVRLDTFVNAVGLDYSIPEDQSGLSAGQKQRLCLARALLNRPDVLILDEATANLDEHVEAEVAAAVNSLKGLCTTVIVSHRPGMIHFADHVIRLSS